ncbi:cobyric acid synthase [Desulfovibrio sp. OttesenSCG-928-F20]|nr:cobyric acid synthase [Desulfovibrio sp. OttesenSCG-928-F20]
MTARTLMIQGTASSAGKSLLVTALCRIFLRRGLSVVPFKAQNMALNSAVTADGHEIGRAQAAQAEAAGQAPSAYMNPVLLKPTGDRRSQVLVMGKSRGHMDARQYYAFRPSIVPEVCEAFVALASRHDLVILEGAGSPAEINLREHDIANMGAAAIADAPVLLVGDIDRGGVFAALYGTVKLLEVEEQRRIRGFVINKFRGDPGILEPGLRQLEYMLARPVLGVLPWWDVHIDEEDSLAERLHNKHVGPCPATGQALADIAVVRLPRLSNFTDFAVFDALPGAGLRYADRPSQLNAAALVIVPGSENPLADLTFLHESGFARAILERHASGALVAGIGSGFQMLGRFLRDTQTNQSDPCEVPGLGLLDLEALLSTDKGSAQKEITLAPDLPGPLQAASGLKLAGYEVHRGGSLAGPSLLPLGRDGQGRNAGGINAEGTVFGSCLHGIFDNLPFTRALITALRQRSGLPHMTLPTGDYTSFREQEYDRLASMVEQHLNMEALIHIIESWPLSQGRHA